MRRPGESNYTLIASRDDYYGFTEGPGASAEFVFPCQFRSASVRFHHRVLLAHAPRWVRVRDRAGNASRWHRVAHTPSVPR